MNEDFESLGQHDFATLVKPPPSAKILEGMWVFAKNRDEFNRVV